MTKSKLEKRFLHGWESYADPSLPLPVAEHPFHPVRKWRWDYAWPDLLIAVDIQGGTFSRRRGRHSRGAGQIGDHEKMNAATLLGWRFLQFSTVDLKLKALPHTIQLVQELVQYHWERYDEWAELDAKELNDEPAIDWNEDPTHDLLEPPSIDEQEYGILEPPRRRPIPPKSTRSPRR